MKSGAPGGVTVAVATANMTRCNLSSPFRSPSVLIPSAFRVVRIFWAGVWPRRAHVSEIAFFSASPSAARRSSFRP